MPTEFQLAPSPLAVANARKVVPILYGRRVIPGIHFSGAGKVRLYALSEGEIDEVVRWFLDGQSQTNKYSGGVMTAGIWYHPGLIGATGADSGMTTEGAAMERPQTADPHDSFNGTTDATRVAYSRLAYAAYMHPPGADEALADDSTLLFDVRGIKVGIYDDEGTLLSTEWSANPIWQIVDVLLQKRRGVGRFLAVGDMDWPSIVAAADYCDVEVESVEAVTTPINTHTAQTSIGVISSLGFYRGMRAEFNGNSRTILDVQQVNASAILVIDSAVTVSNGQVIQGFTKRFESHAYFESMESAHEILADLLASCRGRICQDDGKIRILIDQAQATSQGHFRDADYAAGYGIVANSFNWTRIDEQKHVNRVVVAFANEAHNGSAVDDEVVETDWDAVAVAEERTVELRLQSVATRDQASRLAQYHLGTRRTRTSGATFKVGPIGLKLQPGDKIEVTHAIPNWSAKACIVRRTEVLGLGSPDELCVQLEVDTYSADVYPDTPIVTVGVRGAVAATVTLAIDQVTPTGIALKWDLAASDTFPVDHWSVYRGYATLGSAPSIVSRIAVLGSAARSFFYPFTSDDNAQPLYFTVRCVSSGVTPDVKSNEVSITSQQIQEHLATGPYNLIHGGDFNDADIWYGDEAIESVIRPNANVANTPEDTGGLTNPANAYDANDTTAAEGVYALVGSAETSAGSIYSFASTGAKTVRPRIQYQHNPSGPGGGLTWHYQYDGGAWIELSTIGPRGVQNQVLFGPVLSVANMNLLNVKVRARAFGDQDVEGNVQFYNVDVMDLTAGPYAIVSGNKLQMLAGDTSTWVLAHCPFPGYQPVRVNTQIRAGHAHVVQVTLQRGGAAAPNAPIEVCVWNADSKTDVVTVLRLDGAGDYAQVTTSPTVFACVWVPAADVKGQLRVLIRSKSTEILVVDKVDIRPGRAWKQAGPSASEVAAGYHYEAQTPLPTAGIRRILPEGPDSWLTVATA